MKHKFCLQLLLLYSLLCWWSTGAHAHGTERGLVMLLPTDYYKLGGTLAVAASFILLIIIPTNWIKRWEISKIPLGSIRQISPYYTSNGAFIFLMLLILAGLFGDTDPYANPMPLFIWTIWWVGFTLLQFITGNLWLHLNPWTGPKRLFCKLLNITEPKISLPTWVGYWPAVILFWGFAWYELVSLSPDDPKLLAQLVFAYWILGFIGILLFGEKQWLGQMEPFAIFFRLIGAFSPLKLGAAEAGKKSSIQLVWPGSDLKNLACLPLSGVLFILLTLSAVSFDGFSKTFAWASLIGINPLEFPGRSAVLGINSLGFLGLFALLTVIFMGSVYTGCLFIKKSDLFMEACGRLIYAIIPISLAFHMAHYLTVLLVNTQYAALAFNDPFALGWNIFGIQKYHVTTSFLTHLGSVEILWIFQTSVIVIGHVISIYLSHVIAGDLFGYKKATLSQTLLAILMIFYTLFGLWLLSTPAMG